MVAASVPLVLALMAAVMHAAGWNLDRISLGALIIALGLLVDDAIIAVEMMVRKMEEGYDKVRAATFAYEVTPVARDHDQPRQASVLHLQPEHRRNRFPETPTRLEAGNAEPEVVDRRPALGTSRPVHGLDAVAVGVEEKAAVIVRAVLRPRAWLPVVRVAGLDSAAPEGVHLVR